MNTASEPMADMPPTDGIADRAPLSDEALDLLFRTARTRNAWLDRPVGHSLLRDIYDLAKMGPTSNNACPARFVFITSAAGRERLRPHLSPGNVDKTMSAPCCVIIAYDSLFFRLLPLLFPARDLRSHFDARPSLVEETAMRNSTLQGAYLIMAARAKGFDCGPISGFNNQSLDREFFGDGRWKSNFLCNIGYGSDVNLFPRNPRLPFDEACRIL